ncbi:hypothetical protein SDC9_54892 [bioreactor metagenome]|uniref:Uncharacterized protein n=1 Tax=bioreactor metagenome TaxID=1076179 RepID=A0A644WXQ1_9ZZZZ
MVAEIGALKKVVAGQCEQVRGIPGIAAEEGRGEAQLFRLLELQGNFVVVVRQEQDFRIGGFDLCELGFEVFIAGLIAFKSNDLAAKSRKFVTENFCQALVVVAGDVIKDGRRLCLQCL